MLRLNFEKIIYIWAIFILIGCGSEKLKKNKSTVADRENTSDSSLIYMNKFIEERKSEVNKKTSLINELIFVENNFSIFCVTESIGDEKISYSVVINSEETQKPSVNDPPYFESLYPLLNRLKKNYKIYNGVFNKTLDADGNGIGDFILCSEAIYAPSTVQRQVIYFYDGKNILSEAPFYSQSGFETGVCDEFIGIKEKIEVDKKGIVRIEHQENIKNHDLCDSLIMLSYEKIYTMESDKWIEHPFAATPGLYQNKLYLSIPHQFFTLIKDDEEWLKVEDCQNGGYYSMEFLDFKESEVKKGIILRFTEDGMDGYFLAGIKRLNAKRVVLYWRPSYDMIGDDDLRKIESQHQVLPMIIEELPVNGEYEITFDKVKKRVTTKPDKYNTTGC